MPSDDHNLEREIFGALRNAILLAVAIYLLLQFLGAVTLIVLLFGLVFLLAAVLNPVVTWLQRYHIPRSASATAFGLLILGGAALALWLGVPPLVQQAEDLVRRTPDFWGVLRDRLQHSMGSKPALRIHVPSWDQLLQILGPYLSRLVTHVGQYTIDLITASGSLVLVIVLVIYSLARPLPLVAGLLGAFPERHRPTAQHILELILTRLKHWAVGTVLSGVIMGSMMGIGLFVLGVPYALVFGVITSFGELLPTLGPILCAMPPVLITLATDPMLALWVIVLSTALHQIENHIIVPLVMSRTVDLHPLSIAFILLVMGALFGLLGALLAVPTALIIKTLYQELYLSRQVTDMHALEAQSQRVISEEAVGAVTAEAEHEAREDEEAEKRVESALAASQQRRGAA